MDDNRRETLEELMQQMDALGDHDPEDIPRPIQDAMLYIGLGAGLLGTYNPAVVTLCEGVDILKVYPRSRCFSAHDQLMLWVQYHPRLVIGQICSGPHPQADHHNWHGEYERTAFIEIHEADRWPDLSDNHFISNDDDE